ncbi:heterogeneous nuclear ribonucleoprotein Q-like isoform X1 [Phoenix dactylifera]|uniref:Heterogeneous nuclear ribonucleoprotein Q-like isoform X1 n=1 Tax=Phoenix dactylifera TaxID=42345 RepID=A0A8B7BIC5_PHODC|nr:heterogeneous nuclear ribonucleoprotein Q-like isoform X1 [Phoenix dactylifera]
MADPEAVMEPEEQVDIEGDNDIEYMMDDDDAVEDYGDRKFRPESPVEGEEREHRSDSEGQEKASPSDGADSAASEPMKQGEEQEERPGVGSRDTADCQKWAELLALPPHGSEVFIGGLLRDATEENLRDLCEAFGEIHDVRLVKDKDTRESKGFAFITFTNKDAAQKAIEELHDKEFKGRTLRCSLSQAKHRLFIGNVPKSLSEEELRKILEESGPGVQNIEMFKDPQNPSRNRGFLFVEYYNHACADYARQKMSSPNFKMDGSNPTVSWADPKNSADSSAAAQGTRDVNAYNHARTLNFAILSCLPCNHAMEKCICNINNLTIEVKALYVKNLPEDVTPEKLRELFERHGEVTKVVLPPAKAGQKRDFGFIHFAERSSALKAVKGTEKYEIDGHVVDVALAKPQVDKKSDYASNSNSLKPGLLPSFPPYPAYGYTGDPYGAYGGGYGAAGFGQPVIYGRGPMPAGMRMVPMVLPDGRLGYVLQQPGPQAAPPPSRRSDRSGGSVEGGGRGSDGNRGRRYRPY